MLAIKDTVVEHTCKAFILMYVTAKVKLHAELVQYILKRLEYESLLSAADVRRLELQAVNGAVAIKDKRTEGSAGNERLSKLPEGN